MVAERKKDTVLAADNGSDAAREIERLNERLGERIKAVRARRGMTRKDLSRLSEVSERYLAQLESGTANASVSVLWRIAHVMNVRLSDLVSDRPDPTPEQTLMTDLVEKLSPEEQKAAYRLLSEKFVPKAKSKSLVALVGLRGAGKTTLGQGLAEAYDVPFISLVDMVEELAGVDVGEIFALWGQKAYRRLEHQALEQVIDKYDRAVVETGGSLVSEPETFNLLLNSCHTIWLQARPEEHMARVVEQGDFRPIESSREAMDDLKRILNEREPYYRRTDMVFDTSGHTVEESLAGLVDACRPILQAGQKETVDDPA